MRVLTGKELKIAAERGLRVRYVDHPYDPSDSKINRICVMRPATYGYYIGPSDINPDDYAPYESVYEDYGAGERWVYAVDGVDYSS